MRTASLIFPNQLFSEHPAIREDVEKVFLVEESLFFGDERYPLRFHRQKLAYHLATLDDYERNIGKRLAVERVHYTGNSDLLKVLTKRLASNGFERILVADVHDFVLGKRLESSCEQAGIQLEVLVSPAFLNSRQENREYRNGRKR